MSTAGTVTPNGGAPPLTPDVSHWVADAYLHRCRQLPWRGHWNGSESPAGDQLVAVTARRCRTPCDASDQNAESAGRSCGSHTEPAASVPVSLKPACSAAVTGHQTECTLLSDLPRSPAAPSYPPPVSGDVVSCLRRSSHHHPAGPQADPGPERSPGRRRQRRRQRRVPQVRAARGGLTALSAQLACCLLCGEVGSLDMGTRLTARLSRPRRTITARAGRPSGQSSAQRSLPVSLPSPSFCDQTWLPRCPGCSTALQLPPASETSVSAQRLT